MFCRQRVALALNHTFKSSTPYFLSIETTRGNAFTASKVQVSSLQIAAQVRTQSQRRLKAPGWSFVLRLSGGAQFVLMDRQVVKKKNKYTLTH